MRIHQRIADDLAIIRLVLDHQNAFAHAFPPERADENAFESLPFRYQQCH